MTRVRRTVLVSVFLVLVLLPSVGGPQASASEALALPGQSATLLSHGRVLLAGGAGAHGPVGTVMIVDPRSGAVSVLPPLEQARAWHTATVLPDGTVLIFGGLDARGQPMAAPEIVDPGMPTVGAPPAPALTPRAQHTATLLTDGRLLLAGGVGDGGQPLAHAEGWRLPTGDVEKVALSTPRARHTATLEADGSVLLWGGVGSGGGEVTGGERFDPATPGFTRVAAPVIGPSDGDGPRLAGSIPAHETTDVPVDGFVALRFSKPLRVDTVHSGTTALVGPDGPDPARIVVAENGMLVFVGPETALRPGTTYTVSVNGAEDAEGGLLPISEVRFTTARPVATMEGADASPGGAAHHPHRAGFPGAASEIDALEWRGAWRDGKPHSPWQDLPPLQAPAGVTALAGQVLRLDGAPLQDVTLEIGAGTARTDQTGRFLLTHIDAGTLQLEMDGSTANRPGRTYGAFSYGIEVVAGQTNVLPFTIWMPLLDMQHATPVPVPTPQEIVATSPRIPGLEVRIPAGVVLRAPHGPLTAISLTQIPVDRPPFPLPPGTVFFFTPQGHGARVERLDGSRSATGVRIVLPNPERLAAGSRVDLVNYDYGRWITYGQGTVTAGGHQIVPDPGVELRRVTCAFILGPPATWVAATLGGARAGDPVDLATGVVTVDRTDLVLPDIIPIVIQRQFRSATGRTHFTLQMYLTGDQTTYGFAELILPDGARVRYDRISPGTDLAGAVLEHTATPTRYYKSRLAWNGTRPGWDLTFPDGTVYEFLPEGKLPGPPLSAIRDRAGNRLTITRNAVLTGQLSRVSSPSGRWVDITQDAADNITQVRDNLGRTVTYTYDGFLRLTSVTDPAGGVTRYGYLPTGGPLLLTIQDPRGVVFLRNEYDANGRVIVQMQADGTSYQFAYALDGDGKVTRTDVTDPRGSVRRVTFNRAGYVLTDTRGLGTPLAQTTTYVRDASNLVTSVTDALGRRTEYTYDGRGNVLTVTRLAGTASQVRTTFTYDSSVNQVRTVTNPLNLTTTFAYDSVGNLIAATDPLNHSTTLTYNAAGQPLTIATPAGTARFGYDQGDLVTISEPAGQTTTRFTDGGGRLISLTSPLGQRTGYDYDGLNRITRITDPLGETTRFSYDANGNLLSVTDARGSVTSYGYDEMDRVVTRTDPLGWSETYRYDAAGSLTGLTDRKSQVTETSYDVLGRPTGVTYQDGSRTAYTWDAGNRLTQLVDSISGTISRAYDDLDRLVQEVSPQGSVSYAYDTAGRRTSMTVLGQPAVNYTYDNADRLTRITQGAATVAFIYDDANRRTSLTLPNGVVTEYAYDAASRLGSLTYRNGAMVLGTLTYGYDANGNRTRIGGTWATMDIPQPVASATYDAANRQLSFGDLTLAYDRNGNLTADGTNTYTWNARNQLAAISGGTLTATFRYDGLGRRQSKTINGLVTDFLYDDLNPVQELTGTAVSANLLIGLGIDEYFMRTAPGASSYMLTDALGSTVALIASSGAVFASYTYEPFGATRATGTSDNPFQYTGRENDDTELYHYRARYYHPTFQRFLSEDPVQFDGGINFYAYVHNNPLGYIDPLGLAAEVCCRLLSRVGAVTRLRHCYIKDDGETFGLYPENGTGFPRRNHPDDAGGICQPCPAPKCSDQKGCFEKAHNSYPLGRYSLLGPNSNTYAATIARTCCQGGLPAGLGVHPGSAVGPPIPTPPKPRG